VILTFEIGSFRAFKSNGRIFSAIISKFYYVIRDCKDYKAVILIEYEFSFARHSTILGSTVLIQSILKMAVNDYIYLFYKNYFKF